MCNLPGPGIERVSVGRQTLNHWTAREVSLLILRLTWNPVDLAPKKARRPGPGYLALEYNALELI